MYLVTWQTNYANAVATGSAVIGATSIDDAHNSILHHFELPRSCTQINVKRLKPPILEIERQERARTQKERSRKRLALGTPPAPLLPFALHISGLVNARDSDHALRCLDEQLRDPAKRNKLMIDCKQVIEKQRKLAPLEAVELYRPRAALGGKGRI
jgi:hypothetical protein